MKFLWSRVAQARSTCHQSSCLHTATTTLARQTTSTTGRRKLKLEDVFTAFYSTVLATAAVADSKVKETRSKEWDRLIDGARAEQLHHAKVDGNSEIDDALDSFTSNRSCSVRPVLSSSGVTTSTFSSLTFTVDSRQLRRKPYLRHNWGIFGRGGCYATLHNDLGHKPNQFHEIYQWGEDRLTEEGDDSELDNELDTAGWIPHVPERNIWNLKDRELLRRNMRQLVHEMLHKSHFYWRSSQLNVSGSVGETQQELQVVISRFAELDEYFDELPLYYWDDLETLRLECQKFEAILKAIFKKATKDEVGMDLTIAKICYNLLISCTPPRTSTYNILLREFSRLGRYDLADAVLASFWYSRLRPNVKTLELILLHYRATKNTIGLGNVIKHMSGARGNLLRMCVRVPPAYQKVGNLRNPSFRAWIFENHYVYRDGKLFKKAPRTNDIFDAIILAHLDLKGPRPAIRYMRAAVQNRSIIKEATLCAVIKACVKQKQFSAGLAVLSVILSQWTTSGYRRHFSFTAHVRDHVIDLLSLCGIEIKNGAVGRLPRPMKLYSITCLRQGLEYPKEALEKMLRLMDIEYISEALEHISRLVDSLRRALSDARLSHVAATMTQMVADFEKAVDIMKRADEDYIVIESRNLRTRYSKGYKSIELQIDGLEASIITRASSIENLRMGIARLQVEACAFHINHMTKTASHENDANVKGKMERLQSLATSLGVLKMLLNGEHYLNQWWIRKNSLSTSRMKTSVQRRRMDSIHHELHMILAQVKVLWEECAGETHASTI